LRAERLLRTRRKAAVSPVPARLQRQQEEHPS
jgi:hypothetical protein